jgi:hypothetical protein
VDFIEIKGAAMAQKKKNNKSKNKKKVLKSTDKKGSAPGGTKEKLDNKA